MHKLEISRQELVTSRCAHELLPNFYFLVTSCVLAVCAVWHRLGRSLGLCTRLVRCVTGPVNKPGLLSPLLPIAFPMVFHPKKPTSLSVTALVLPTFHTTNKSDDNLFKRILVI